MSSFFQSKKPWKNQYLGFSLIEILVVIALISVLTIIGVTYGNNYKLSQYNVRRIDDIKTLTSAMESYILAKKTMPDTLGNTRYYDVKGNYIHNAKGAFGASSFVTPDTFPREYLNTFPLDPQTNHYYAYGRRYDGTIGYEFATIINDGGQYSTYLRGNYDGSILASLIKEAQGPNFVDEGTITYLPYNPEELKVTGRIYFMSGSVQISHNGGTTWADFDDPKLLIGQGDSIKVLQGGNTTVYLSDGSEMVVGSTTSDTIIDFDTLKYNGDNNLSSQVENVLTMGEVWVRAPKYYNTSGFSVQTDGQVATVRGTVFGVKKTTSGKSFTLAQGVINIAPDDSQEYDKNRINGLASLARPGFKGDDQLGSLLMDANVSGKPITFSEPCYQGAIYPNGSSCPINMTLRTADTSTGEDLARATFILHTGSGVHSGRIPRILKINKDDGLLSFEVENFGANELEITAPTLTAPIINNASSSGGSIIYTDGDDAPMLARSPSISIKLCYNPLKEHMRGERICSATKTIDLPVTPNEYSFSGKILDSQDAASTYPTQCAPGTVVWGRSRCEDENLIAMASYDRPGDIFLHTRDGGVLPTKSKNIISSGALNKEEILNKDGYNGFISQVGSLSGASCIPKVISGSIFASGTEACSGTLSTLNQNGIIYQPSTSFFGFPDRTGGIFINNSPSQSGSLSYDLSSLSLSGGLTIEIGVRGAALLRNDGMLYTLLDNNYPDLQLTIKDRFIKLVSSGSILSMNPLPGCPTQIPTASPIKSTFCLPLSADTITPNTNYRIILSTNLSKNSITILGPNNTTIASSGKIFANQARQVNNIYHIGVTSFGDRQWNDIVNSLRIIR